MPYQALNPWERKRTISKKSTHVHVQRHASAAHGSRHNISHKVKVPLKSMSVVDFAWHLSAWNLRAMSNGLLYGSQELHYTCPWSFTELVTNACMYIYIYTYTHTHTHICIYALGSRATIPPPPPPMVFPRNPPAVWPPTPATPPSPCCCCPCFCGLGVWQFPSPPPMAPNPCSVHNAESAQQ